MYKIGIDVGGTFTDFLLTRDDGTSERLDVLADTFGVWRCRTIFNCTEACPRGIEVTKAIQEVKRAMITRAKHNPEEIPLTKKDRKRLKKIYRQELVKRKHLYRIAAAWVITVPASALLGALMFYLLRGMLLEV